MQEIHELLPDILGHLFGFDASEQRYAPWLTSSMYLKTNDNNNNRLSITGLLTSKKTQKEAAIVIVRPRPLLSIRRTPYTCTQEMLDTRSVLFNKMLQLDADASDRLRYHFPLSNLPVRALFPPRLLPYHALARPQRES